MFKPGEDFENHSQEMHSHHLQTWAQMKKNLEIANYTDICNTPQAQNDDNKEKNYEHSKIP